MRQAEEAEAKAAVSNAEQDLKTANLATSASGLEAAQKKANAEMLKRQAAAEKKAKEEKLEQDSKKYAAKANITEALHWEKTVLPRSAGFHKCLETIVYYILF